MGKAIEHHLAGRLVEAEALYVEVLQAQPGHADANHNMGLMAVQRGQLSVALPYLRAALLANPAQGLYALSYAEALLASGQAGEALSIIAAAIERGFGSLQATALHEKAQAAVRGQRTSVVSPPEQTAARVAHQDRSGVGGKRVAGKAQAKPSRAVGPGTEPPPDEAKRLIDLYQAARYAELENRASGVLKQYPDSALVWKAYWVALRNQGKEALPALRRAIELAPDDAELHTHLGNALRSLGQFDDAEASLRRALALNPEFAEAHNSLGCVFRDLGRGDAAEVSYRRALALSPAYVDGLNNLGRILAELRRYDEALATYGRSLEINPGCVETHIGLSNALRVVGRMDEALASCHRALAIDPQSVTAWAYLGNVLMDLGRHAEAAQAYRRARQIRPDAALVYSNLLFCLSLDEQVDAQALFVEHCRFGEQFEAPLRAKWSEHGNSRDPERCLQVGFVSGDFRNHAVTALVEVLFAQLASEPSLSLHAYVNHAAEDEVTRRLRGYFKHWHRVVGLSDEALAQAIRDDGIDILVDLSGHTEFNRLLCFARKPAPVQASWVGYPGTTGLRAMDYVLADRHWLPPGQFDAQFTEKIVHLPATSPASTPADAPPVNALPALRNAHLTFGSFNRANKLSRAVIALWSRLLRALPDARMVLGGLPEKKESETLSEWFEQEGIARDRLSFHPRCAMGGYLELYHQVDICLDTFPYNGGTTTYFGLWMGVPTLTLAGNTPAGRSGAAIMGHLGLNDLVARDADDFVAKGLAMAADYSRLSAIRSGLRERMGRSDMGQPARVADGLHRALRQMWRRWCAGLPAQSFVVSPDTSRPESIASATCVGDPLPRFESEGLRALADAGKYPELEDRAAVLARQYPDSGGVWTALARALGALGKDALDAWRSAARVLPDDPEVLIGLGEAQGKVGQLAEAAESYRRALAIRSDNVHALGRLGDVLRRQGQFEEAVTNYRRALEISPDSAVTHNDLACALAGLRRFAEAVASFRAALAIRPGFYAAHNNLGNALRSLGRFAEAEDSFRAALDLRPDLAVLHNNLGNALRDSGQLEAAVASYRRALEIEPDYAEAHNNLGTALVGQGRFEDAALSFRRALEIKPGFAAAYNNLGHVLRDLGRLDEALSVFLAAQKTCADLPELRLGLGNVLANLGRHREAVLCYRQLLAAHPDYSSAYHNLLFTLSLDDSVDAQILFAEHCRFGERFEAPLRAQWTPHDNVRDPERRLQVGIVSGDLHSHAVAFFIEPLLAYLSVDPMLSLHAYSNYAHEDEVSARLKAYFGHWHRIVDLSDEALAQKIRSDGIDILIDLSGHTAHNRLLCFARKPAPVQATWLGYPGTTGLQAMDYFLADRHWLPPGRFDGQFTEKIVYMPATSPFSAPADAPQINELPALGNGYLTFGSFNRSNKISRTVIALWSRLLRALPQSRMVLGGLPEEGKYETLIEWFAQEGIDRDRLSFHARCGMISYLGLHHRVDICLDTFPYTGGTTTFFSLWMGVPTLTVAGKTVASRSSVSILESVGLEGFVAHDGDDFVAKGVAWAGRMGELATFRAQMRERFARSDKGQLERAADGVRQALRQMWRRWCAGLPPESFAVLADTAACEASGEDRQAVAATETAEVAAATPIYVTQPVLPPLEDFIPYLKKIWASKRLTNGGQFHQQLEQSLCDYLGVKYLSLFANGTLALVTALQALRIKGEVITTPYSFVATSHALLWNGIKPVFVDIDERTLNIDASRIEAAITPKTTAILPVHCYGHTCDVEAIQAIADNYNLRVIYDAAHAFGVRDAQGSVLRYGDLSVLSFHATKVFNTFEGGAIICPDARTKQHIDHLKNFGFVDEVTVVAAGINGKMSEINAAFGLLQLKGIDAALHRRRAIDAHYRQALAGVAGIRCVCGSRETVANYSYFPILVGPEYPLDRDGLFDKLNAHGVFARRYFYPLISEFSMYRGIPSAAPAHLPVARRVAAQVICLPIYPDLSEEQVELIVRIVRGES